MRQTTANTAKASKLAKAIRQDSAIEADLARAVARNALAAAKHRAAARLLKCAQVLKLFGLDRAQARTATAARAQRYAAERKPARARFALEAQACVDRFFAEHGAAALEQAAVERLMNDGNRVDIADAFAWHRFDSGVRFHGSAGKFNAEVPRDDDDSDDDDLPCGAHSAIITPVLIDLTVNLI